MSTYMVTAQFFTTARKLIFLVIENTYIGLQFIRIAKMKNVV
jgi:hypothetical protein